jgi:glycine/D-amino acid oxidase-like deaminating enzyme
LPKRNPTPSLQGQLKTPWLIIGAGYTGLSAAQALAAHCPSDSILLIDAQLAGEGASSRNSGYLVDSTLNDGHLSDSGLENYLAKYELNRLGVAAVDAFVRQHQVDCDWNACGKFHATAMADNEAKLESFSQTLSQCDIGHDVFTGADLANRLGTGFYRMAVHTHGGVLLQPGKLARGMIDALPDNVSLHENSPVMRWQKTSNGYEVATPSATIHATNLLVCANGFLPSLGFKKDRVFPLTLTASLTRPLKDSEFESIGSPREWGVLSAGAMGATVRLTADRRIMIRNTAEAVAGINFRRSELERRISTHQTGLRKRFPTLPENLIETSWSGVTCISGNSANLFEQLAPDLFVAGCYNGGGIGLATLFGEQLALKACGGTSEAMSRIENRPKPNWLPPNPFLRWGVKARLLRDRLGSASER